MFLRSFMDSVINKSTPITPKKRGNLRQDILKQVSGLSGKLIWGKDYAIYQEKKQYKNYTTPGTGPGFAEKSVRDAYKIKKLK